MDRAVYFEPGCDTGKPPRKSVAAMRIRFVLTGDRGAVQFLLGTDWYPLSVQNDAGWSGHYTMYRETKPMAWDLGYHSRAPMHDDQIMIEEKCSYLGGKPCYYDGSSLNAEPIRDEFLARGDAAVWESLEHYYVDTFGKDEEEAQ
jgi:hypothetical protein